MDKKKQIGKKIWELFIKNNSYSQIAKQVGVNKSVVSNVINYSLPAKEWIQEDVKRLKTKCKDDKEYIRKTYKNKLKECEENWEEEINKLEEEHETEKKDILLDFSILSGYITGIISTVILLIVYNFNIPIPSPSSNLPFFLITIFGIGATLGLISFFIIKFISIKISKED